jgi:hypothetical protein
MLTTVRVGDPDEDASMAAARPLLANINRLGFLTIDSQMGKKETKTFQRAYICGLVTKDTADRLKNYFRTIDSVLVFAFPHGETAPPGLDAYAFGDDGGIGLPRIEVSLGGPNLSPVTRLPLGIGERFESAWNGVLPEVRDELQTNFSTKGIQRLKERCCAQSVYISVVDTVWGRRTKMFTEVVRALQMK